MCTYSAMADEITKPWRPKPDWWDEYARPKPAPMPGIDYPIPVWPQIPNPSYISPEKITPEIAKQLLGIFKKLEELDKKTSTCPCKFDKSQKKALVSDLKKRAKAKK